MSFRVIGHIVKAHGLKGEVQVHLDVPDRDFCSLKNVFVGPGESPDAVYELENVAIQNGKVIAALSKIDNRNDSEKLKGCKLFIPEKIWNELQNVETEIPDYSGWLIIDADSGQELARATTLLVDPRYATALLEIEHSGRISLIPWVDEFIIGLDEADRQIRVKLQEGLLNED